MADAVELLLELQIPNKISLVIFPWMKALLLVLVFVGIVVRIRPIVVVGIGKGSRSIKIWRIWLGIIGITIPTLIFGSFIWPYLVKVITKF